MDFDSAALGLDGLEDEFGDLRIVSGLVSHRTSPAGFDE